MSPAGLGSALDATPPLDPSPSEARSLLGRELLHPEYHQRDPVQAVLDWIDRFVGNTLDRASGIPPLSTFAAMLAILVLGLALAWLVSRARRTARVAREPGAVLEDHTLTARELRERAELALADGRAEDALVDGFRALTLRQVEHGRLEDLPGATAHEVAMSLAVAHPDRVAEIADAAALFDAVRYGGRATGPADAAGVLALDDALTKVRR